MFRVEIENRGDGDITLVDDHLKHGIWSDNRSPTQSAALIRPGEKRGFESVDGGDIPIIGNFATGTEGWVLFRTMVEEFVGSPAVAFIRIAWNLPYLDLDPDKPTVTATRDDPRTVWTGFEKPDPNPPPIQMSDEGGVPPDMGGDNPLRWWPWVLYLPVTPLGLGETNIGVVKTIVIYNTAIPSSTKLLLPLKARSPSATPEPIIHTNSSMWEGTWRGPRVVARISKADGGKLRVQVTEQVVGKTLEHPSELVGISKLIQELRGPQMFTDAGRRAALDPLHGVSLREQEFVGRQVVSRELALGNQTFMTLVAEKPSLVASARTGRHQIGGDYLRMSYDATLEIYRMVSDGEVVDMAIRYRHPATQGTFVGPHIDELLRYEPPVA